MKTWVSGKSHAAVHARRARSVCCAETLESRQLLSGDLAGAFTGVIPTAFLPGGKNKLALRVNNVGDTDIADAFRVALFASTDATLDDGDSRIFAVDKHSKLKAITGGTNVKLSFPSPTTVPDGDYFILAQIDETGGITENDENNNTVATPATVEIRQPFVDLSSTADLVASTVAIAVGKKAKAPKITFVLSNAGNVPALGNLTANVFASTDATIGDADDISLGATSRKVGLKPGKSLKLKPKLVIPENLPTGNYNIVATFDYAGTSVQESNPSDNRAVSAAQFAVDNPAFPAVPDVPPISDLSVDSTTMLVANPEQVIFDVTLGSPAGASVVLNEVDSGGNLIGKVADLLDNGSAANSDATAADGIFSGNTAVVFNSAGDRFFQAKVIGSDLATPILKITGINAPSEAQVQAALDLAGGRQAALSAALGSGTSPSAAIQSLAAGLATQPDVQPDSIKVGAQAVSYVNVQGILTYLSADPALASTTPRSGPGSGSTVNAGTLPIPAPLEAAGADCGCADPVSAALEGDVACDKAIVLSAFASGNPFATEATNFASKLLNPPSTGVSQKTFSVAGPTFEAGVDSYKALGQNKVIYLGGESIITEDGIALETGETATALGSIARIGDIASRRIAISGTGKYILPPRFFSHYNGDMDGAIVFADIDNSTQDISLASSFLRRGAKAFYGFTTSAVSEANAVTIATATLDQLLQDQTVATARDFGGASASAGVFSSFGTDEAKLEAGCDLLAENDLLITYTWNQTQKDLDTATEFLGASAGFSCSGPSEFMTFSGDNTSGGGTETVTINLQAAFAAGQFTTNTSVTCSAGWFSGADPVGTGPAVLTVSLRSKVNSELRQVLTRTISPGTQSGCAATLVGLVNIAVTQDASPRVSITLT